MKLKYDFVHRNIAGEHILVPSGSSSAGINGIITASRTGDILMEALKEDTTEEKLTGILTDRFSISESEAASDVHAFLSKLREHGLLEE